MRQRLAIAQAMLGLPELLVLDEPTNGLDPPQIHAMREVLRRYAAGGRTVLVSSHLLAEVEQTCTHVVVMHHGKVVADGTVEDIIAGGGAATFTVDAPDRAAAVLGALDGVQSVEVADGRGARRAERHPAGVRGAGAGVRRASTWPSAGPRRRLEDAFLQLVGEDLDTVTPHRAADRGRAPAYRPEPHPAAARRAGPPAPAPPDPGDVRPGGAAAGDPLGRRSRWPTTARRPAR